MRILVFVNTLSGQSDSGLYDFIRTVGMTGAEITMRFFDGTTAMESMLVDADKFDRVVAAGGDGTASAVTYALRDSGVPVLVYPAGTANALAINLGLPIEHRALADVLLEGVAQRFDLGETTQMDASGQEFTRGFAIMAGSGFDATLMEAAAPLKSAMGPAAYLAAAVANLAPSISKITLELDGATIHTEGIAVLIVNFGRIQFDLPVTHGTDPRDGIFEVAVLRSRHLASLVPTVIAAMLDRSGDFAERGSGLDVYSASTVRVEADPAMRIQYDGDVMDAVTPFSARVLPLAATLLVPADSPYVRR